MYTLAELSVTIAHMLTATRDAHTVASLAAATLAEREDIYTVLARYERRLYVAVASDDSELTFVATDALRFARRFAVEHCDTLVYCDVTLADADALARQLSVASVAYVCEQSESSAIVARIAQYDDTERVALYDTYSVATDVLAVLAESARALTVTQIHARIHARAIVEHARSAVEHDNSEFCVAYDARNYATLADVRDAIAVLDSMRVLSSVAARYAHSRIYRAFFTQCEREVYATLCDSDSDARSVVTLAVALARSEHDIACALTALVSAYSVAERRREVYALNSDTLAESADDAYRARVASA